MTMIYDWQLTDQNACKKARLYEETMTESTADKTNQKIRNLSVPTIKKWFSGFFPTRKALEDFYHEEFMKIADGSIPCSKTRELREEKEMKLINRYLDCEKEKLEVALPQSFEIFGLDAEITPTFVAVYDDKIRVVKVKNAKPSVSARGQKNDTKLSLNKPLYTYLRYGANLLAAGETKEIEASFYYLQQKTDKTDWDNEFFPYVMTTVDKNGKDRKKTINHGNVVSVSQTYTKNLYGEIERTELDDFFEPLFKAWEEGYNRECNATDCAFCSNYGLCTFAKTVEPLPPKAPKRSKAFLPSNTQEEVINVSSGITELIAGAGSGKSTVLIENTLQLLNSCRPQKILILMYNKDAQKEFKQKLMSSNRGRFKNIDKVKVQTFDGFCYNIIKEEEHYKMIGFSDIPSLIETNDKARMIEGLVSENILNGMDYTILNSDLPTAPGVVQTVMKAFEIIKRKNLVYGDEQLLKKEMDALGKSTIEDDIAYCELMELFAVFDDKMKELNLIEYADMPNMVLTLLEIDPYLLNKYGYRHIRVDEFQDVDQKEFDILSKLLDTPAFRSMIVVGDDSQSIYGFKGANPEYIIHLEEKIHEKVNVIYMTDNYRCQGLHVDLANKIVAKNNNRMEKECNATRVNGKQPEIHCYLSQDDEYDAIIESIQDLIKNGKQPEDIAILLADNGLILKMQDKLVRAGIPVNVKARAKIQENPRVLSAQGLRKAFDNPWDTAGIQSYLNGLNEGELFEKYDKDAIIDMINDWQIKCHKFAKYSDAKKGMAFMREIRKLDMKDELYADFISNLYPYAEKGYKELSNHMQSMELYGSKDTYKKEADYAGVILTTLHSSKGLEYDTVFVSLTKVHPKTEMKPEELEEKRRLIYVAYTRAKNELYISSVLVASGDKKNRQYNRFLLESYEALGIPFDPAEAEKTLTAEAAARALASVK